MATQHNDQYTNDSALLRSGTVPSNLKFARNFLAHLRDPNKQRDYFELQGRADAIHHWLDRTARALINESTDMYPLVEITDIFEQLAIIFNVKPFFSTRQEFGHFTYTPIASLGRIHVGAFRFHLNYLEDTSTDDPYQRVAILDKVISGTSHSYPYRHAGITDVLCAGFRGDNHQLPTSKKPWMYSQSGNNIVDHLDGTGPEIDNKRLGATWRAWYVHQVAAELVAAQMGKGEETHFFSTIRDVASHNRLQVFQISDHTISFDDPNLERQIKEASSSMAIYLCDTYRINIG